MMMPILFVGIVCAVRERERGGAEPLDLPQMLVEGRARALHEESHHPVYPKPHPESNNGGDDQGQQDLVDTRQVTLGDLTESPYHVTGSRRDDDGPGQSPDERVGG